MSSLHLPPSLLLCLGVPLLALSAAHGAAYSDAFDGPGLGPDWTVDAGAFGVAGGVLVEQSGQLSLNARMRFVGGATAGASQYAKLRVVSQASHSWGFMLRVGGGSGRHYEVHLPPGVPQWRWELYDPGYAGRIDQCEGDAALQNGDWIGAAVQGSGSGTRVSVWRWDDDPDGGGAPDVAGQWGAPDCVLLADPSLPVDDGAGLGIRSHTGASAAPAAADDWSAGDFAAAACGNGVVEVGEQCDEGAPTPECTAACTVATCAETSPADFAFDLFVVDPAYPGNGAPGWSAAADVDDDGLVDVVSGGGGVLQWYRAPLLERFAIDLAAGAAPGSNGGQIFDVDGDGDLDVVTGLYFAGLAWWENPGPGPASQGPWTRHVIDGAVPGFHHDLVRGDVDGDGQGELVSLYVGGGVYWYDVPAAPAAGPWPRTRILASIADPFVGLALGDLDADGDLDVVASSRWYERPSDPTTPDWTQRTVFSEPVQNLAVVDVDGDGRLDVAGAQGFVSPDGKLVWAQAPVDPHTGSWTETVVADDLDGPESLWAGDLDKDGDVDFVTAEMGSSDGYFDDDSTLVLFEGRDAVGADFCGILLADGVGVSARLTPVDFDGDGDVDFTADGNAEDHVYLWTNETVLPPKPPKKRCGLVGPEALLALLPSLGLRRRRRSEA